MVFGGRLQDKASGCPVKRFKFLILAPNALYSNRARAQVLQACKYLAAASKKVVRNDQLSSDREDRYLLSGSHEPVTLLKNEMTSGLGLNLRPDRMLVRTDVNPTD